MTWRLIVPSSLLVALAAVGACAQATSGSGGSFDGAPGAGGIGGAGGTGGAGLDAGVGGGSAVDVSMPLVDGGQADADGAPDELLCGVRECVPDDVTACDGFEHPDTTPPAPEGSGGSTHSGWPPQYQPQDAVAFGCQVQVDRGQPVSRCGVAGTALAGEPCTDADECAPGLGCVSSRADNSVGRCRPYCCVDPEGCEAGSFCTPRPSKSRADAPDVEPPSVPVCVPADGCSLGEPYPCPADNLDDCTCGAELACSVVRADGTTSCVTPGSGVAGEPCPCAAGFICSQASGLCVKICNLGTSATDPQCGAGKCQTIANFPSGYGVCVADDVDAG